MSVYIFTLMVGYIFGGSDIAQGYRARMLNDVPFNVKYIFTEPPTKQDVTKYEKAGIRCEQMLCMHQYFTDNHTLRLNQKTEDKIKELEKYLHCTSVEQHENEIWMIRDGFVVAAILLDEMNKGFYYGIHYYSQAKLIRTEIYTDGLSYANCYATAKCAEGNYAKIVRRTFYNRNGSVAYEQIFEKEKEWYLFQNGQIYTKHQFLAAFIQKLDLCKKDVVIIDRPVRVDLIQPIFQFKKEARLILIIHSKHFYEENEDLYELYLAREYYYSFKYSGKLDTIVVSTEAQKKELMGRLLDYKCSLPQITVIPAGGIDNYKKPQMQRRPYSLISVSRIERRKRIDWIIQSVIKAHRRNSNISIDIYGSNDGYLACAQKMISQNHAESYIHLMGWADVTEIYKNYEVYLTASLGETLGLSLLEAVASGTAMIGLDVKYGNHVFIQSEQNGYLIDFDKKYMKGDGEELTDAIAEKIIEIFSDEKRLERFHQASYEIAKGFASGIIREKWKKLLS